LKKRRDINQSWNRATDKIMFKTLWWLWYKFTFTILKS